MTRGDLSRITFDGFGDWRDHLFWPQFLVGMFFIATEWIYERRDKCQS